VATEKEIIALLVEIPPGNVLTLLGISAEWTATISKIVFLPFKPFQVVGNHVDEHLVNVCAHSIVQSLKSRLNFLPSNPSPYP